MTKKSKRKVDENVGRKLSEMYKEYKNYIGGKNNRREVAKVIGNLNCRKVLNTYKIKVILCD